jgi:hypothetical protein
MEGADPSRVMRDARALGQNAGETPLATKADDLDAIKKAVEDAAAVSGGLWLSYLFILFYIAIAAGAVTHVDLLLQRAVKLPFLNVELPLLAFFALAPFLFLVTHAYILAHFVMLGKRASRFHEQRGGSCPSRSTEPDSAALWPAVRGRKFATSCAGCCRATFSCKCSLGRLNCAAACSVSS